MPIGWRLHVLLVQHVEDAVAGQDRQHLLMRIDREGRALAHRQQACDRIDFAVGQDHACNRRMAQRAGLGMQLRRGIQLLAQIRGGVDQEPVLAVATEGDRGLGSMKLMAVARAARQPSQPQFHCGTPPPAAAPRTTTRSMIRLLEATSPGGSSGRHSFHHPETDRDRQTHLRRTRTHQPLTCGWRSHTC